MGMYTQLVLGVDLKQNVPAQVVEVLKHMFDEKEPCPQPLPDHPLFCSERWRYMLQCDSYYFHGFTTGGIQLNESSEQYKMTIHCNLKNYDSEIEKFIEWITPYLDTTGFLGYKRYEEDPNPTLLYNGEE